MNTIATKPIKNEDELDKSRHVTGFNKWARSSRAIGIIMLFLNWFTIPFEIIFRRDFGQRWFTTINFIFGFLLIILIAGLQGAAYGLSVHLQDYFSWLGSNNPFSQDLQMVEDNLADMKFILAVDLFYFYMGLYHLFKIKWRNQANIPLHSFDYGTSRLQGVAKILMFILNILSIPFLGIYWLLIPVRQRRGRPFPKMIVDHQAFTNVVVEPMMIFFLAYNLTSVARYWLYLSGFALLIHAHWRELARKTKMLDFRDSKIEAGMMRELKNGLVEKKLVEKKLVKVKPMTAAERLLMKIQKETEPFPQAAIIYPDLRIIIEELNREKVIVAK
jgi:hypothetical protein